MLIIFLIFDAGSFRYFEGLGTSWEEGGPGITAPPLWDALSDLV
jgi:hypothetical protein